MNQIIAAVLLSFAAFVPAKAQPGFSSLAAATNLTQQILQMHTFREGLVWIGPTEPGDAENLALLKVLDNLRQTSWTGELEEFLNKYPHSPWAASLRHDYASFCRRTGRTTKALDLWEAAWNDARQNTDLQSQRLTETIAANWMELLASLGRADKLKELIIIGDRLHFASREDRDKFQGAKNSYYLMLDHPGIAYRCGTFALRAVGKLSEPGNLALEELPEIPSPTNGFNMAELVDLSKKYGLNLVAARRTQGQDLIVPSVVHWRQNHYAAILERRGDQYLVSDPTFGQEKFMSAEVINEEASGEFLIPAALLTNGWSEMGPDLAERIHGMGLPNNINDGKDKGAHPPCNGMPIWWVTEPYVSLWMADEPLSYRTSSGEPFTFRLSYKQRDSRPATNDYLISTGGWNNSWLSYLVLDSSASCPPQERCIPALSESTATLYLPDGGEVGFALGQSYDQETRLTLQPEDPHTGLATGDDSGANGLRLIHPDGSQDVYATVIYDNFSVSGDDTISYYLRTRHIDPHGNTTWFSYYDLNEFYVLTHVVDPDGLTNTLKYTTNSLLSEVDNPYGLSAKFYYDSQGDLTNLVDAQGLSSSITYDTNDNPASLTTPYGTTHFSVFENSVIANTNNLEGNFGGDNLIDRAVQAIDPVGATSLYLYRYDCSLVTPVGMPTNFSSSLVPTNTPLGTLDTGTGGTNQLENVCYRNSFYWGPRQFEGLSTTNMNSFITNDYLRGRMRHWLQDGDDLDLSEYLSVEQDPSPDGSAQGLLTFYDYQGKVYPQRSGTNPLPSVAAWRLPNGETHYQYALFDNFGNITNLISTYSLANGTLGTRTNRFVYANNTYTYTLGTPNGSGGIINTITNSFTIPDLLTTVIGADGTTNWSFGGFDTVAWTNFYFESSGGPTNESILASLRILPDYATNAVGQAASFAYTGGSQPVTYYDLNPTNYSGTNVNYGAAQITAVNGWNKVASATSVAGLTSTNIFNASNFLAQSIDLQLGRTNSFGYTSNGLIGNVTNSLGLAVGISWDNLLRPTALQFPDATYISNAFYNLDLGGARDRLGNWTTFTYDGARHLIAATNALANITQLGWCGCGALTTITNASNQVTTLIYDNQGRLTNVAFPDTSSLSYQFDLAGRLTNAFDGSGRSVQVYYNNQGLPIAVSNTFGALASAVYDIRDRPLAVTDANGVTVTNTFDSLNRLVARVWPDGIGEGYVYASNGLIAFTNRDQKVTHFGRDSAERLTSVTNANGEVTQLAYDAADDITNLVDGNAHQTAFQYDQFGRLTNKLNNLNNSVLQLAYDADERVTNRWMPATGNTGFAYDALGNLTNIAYPSGAHGISLAYDKLNQLISLVDGVGTTAFGYTTTGQLQSENGPWSSDAVSYAYNQGQRTNLSINSVAATGYAYDSAWRLTNLVSPAGSFAYGYGVSASSLIQNLLLPNFASITSQYDSLARLTNTTLQNYWGHVLDGYGYGYGRPELRTSVIRNLGLSTNIVTAGYDNIGQITGWTANESGGAARLNEQLGYGYDAGGNLHLRTNNALVQTFNTDSLNQLSNVTRTGTFTLSGALPAPAVGVSVNGSLAQTNRDFTFATSGLTLTNGNNTFTVIATNTYGVKTTNALTLNLPSTVTFQFDSNGNLTGDGTRVFLYGAENQLTNVYVTNAWREDFIYDGFGRKRINRIYVWQSGHWAVTGETRQVYDGMNPIQERDSNSVPLVTYTRGLDLSGGLQGAGGIGGLLARTDANGSVYYHADGTGNITALIDANQNIVGRREYDAYGKSIGAWGTNANRYWNSSKELDSISGLVYYDYRFLEPNFQRWLNHDPLGESGGINLYGFVANNPISRVDPLGLEGNPISSTFPGLSGMWNNNSFGGSGTFYQGGLNYVPGLLPQPNWVDYVFIGVIYGAGGTVFFVFAAPEAVELLVVAGVTETTATATVTTTLGLAGAFGGGYTAANACYNGAIGNWKQVQFDAGLIGGGVLVGGLFSGGRFIADNVSPTPSTVPESWWPFTADSQSTPTAPNGYGFQRNPALPLGQDLWNWLGTGPTPTSGGGAATFISSGANALIISPGGLSPTGQ